MATRPLENPAPACLAASMVRGQASELEQSTWANPARVDTLARTQLGLVAPPHERIHVETLVGGP